MKPTILKLTVATSLLLQLNAAHAQFNINETFKNNTVNAGVTLGGNASLTSGVSDPQGEGWLRLTESINYQAGYAIINQAFPSNLGVLIDFEYTTWSAPGAGSGADGLSVFLFDATYADSFHIGGYGGSLGYARHGALSGLSGGYMGLGLDEFGNYSNPTESRNGGPGFTKNAVALRGPAPNYAYLSGNQVISSDTGSGDNGGIDYNTTTSTRPTPGQFYRRVQVSLEPNEGFYTVTVRWKKSPTAPFTTLFGPVTMTSPPPAMLKLGLAASTGAQHNYHEIRNMVITTPGSISVDKQGPAYITNNGTAINLNYDITVKNQTPVTVNSIQIADLLPPGYTVNLADITIEHYGNSTNSVTDLAVNNGILSGVATVAANAEVTMHIHGTISNLQPGQSIRNTVKISTTTIQDMDTINNADTVYTIVQAPLPVRLNYFNVQKQQKDVVLRWETATEMNNDHFDIERSNDGKHFTKVGEVAGKGNSTTAAAYTFTDMQAAAGTGTLYYRLHQVDHDGQSDYSMIRSVSLEGPGEQTALRAFPVPFDHNLTVSIDCPAEGKLSITLVNASGIKVYQKELTAKSGANNIKLTELGSAPPGIYVLSCTINGITSFLKISKQ
jgi:uncharacterized repeat protein (TIGR01451 family)